jgi:hypothetical protein
VLGTGRNQPRIASIELDHLPRDGELGASGDDVADSLVLSLRCGLALRLLVAPQPQRNPLPRDHIGLVHFAMR